MCGPFLEIESIISIKGFFNSFGCNNILYFENFHKNVIMDFRIFFLLNKTLVELEYSFNYFFFGTNPRLEVPLLNVRIRKSYLIMRIFHYILLV